MHLVIIWVNTDSADLFIGDKNCTHERHRHTNKQGHTQTHTVAMFLFCNASNMGSTPGGEATRKSRHASFSILRLLLVFFLVFTAHWHCLFLLFLTCGHLFPGLHNYLLIIFLSYLGLCNPRSTLPFEYEMCCLKIKFALAHIYPSVVSGPLFTSKANQLAQLQPRSSPQPPPPEMHKYLQ